MVAMSTDADGQKLLENLNFKPIGTARDQDWNDVRELGIDLLQYLIIPWDGSLVATNLSMRSARAGVGLGSAEP